MKRLKLGILVGGIAIAMVVILGASQESRTSSKELVFGTFTCNASANGEFNASLTWSGTVGIDSSTDRPIRPASRPSGPSYRWRSTRSALEIPTPNDALGSMTRNCA